MGVGVGVVASICRRCNWCVYFYKPCAFIINKIYFQAFPLCARCLWSCCCCRRCCRRWVCVYVNIEVEAAQESCLYNLLELFAWRISPGIFLFSKQHRPHPFVGEKEVGGGGYFYFWLQYRIEKTNQFVCLCVHNSSRMMWKHFRISVSVLALSVSYIEWGPYMDYCMLYWYIHSIAPSAWLTNEVASSHCPPLFASLPLYRLIHQA